MNDFIEDEINRESVFTSEHFLSIDYVPDHLPHRTAELRALAQGFKVLLNAPGTTSLKYIIEGPVGTGKTAVAKLFSKHLIDSARRRNINLHKIHINCRINKSPYLIYLKILRMFRPNFPRRGHSPEEVLQMILEVLDQQDCYLLLILDELDYFIKQKGADILYELTRVMDDRLNEPQRISLIGIGRGIPLTESLLDLSTLSTLQRNVIRFEKYTHQQLYDILQERVKLAFEEHTVMDETLQVICDIASEHGDARYAIELLWRAGKQADALGSKKVIPDYARQAKADTHPELRQEVFTALPYHNQLFLLAAARCLKEARSAYVTIGEVEDMYGTVCEEYGETPRAHTQIWEWVQDLTAHGVIHSKRSGQGHRGQTTLIGFLDVPANLLEHFLLSLLDKE